MIWRAIGACHGFSIDHHNKILKFMSYISENMVCKLYIVRNAPMLVHFFMKNVNYFKPDGILGKSILKTSVKQVCSIRNVRNIMLHLQRHKVHVVQVILHFPYWCCWISRWMIIELRTWKSDLDLPNSLVTPDRHSCKIMIIIGLQHSRSRHISKISSLIITYTRLHSLISPITDFVNVH